jgi:tyrosyl-tRNA synthetase
LIYQWSSDELVRRLDHDAIAAYVGFDPTANSLHVGNLLQLCNMRRLQDAGHRPVFVAGGGTGMIGDPSGKSEERNLLDDDQLHANLVGVRSQLERYLDFSADAPAPAVVLNNRDWLAPLTMIEFLRDVGKHFNVNTMLQKDSVRSRVGEEGGFSYTEFSYMLLQAYDFYHLHLAHSVSLQLGGSDQWGNITAGIDFVRRKTGHEVFGITSPLVTRADGKKFGKSESGAVWLDPAQTSPFQLFQFFMRSEDEMVESYLKFFTFLSLEEIQAVMERSMAAPERRIAQEALATAVTTFVHSAADAAAAKRASEALYQGKLHEADLDTLRVVAGEAPTYPIQRARLDEAPSLVDVMVEWGMVASKGEARRLISQGGLSLNGMKIDESSRTISSDDLLHGSVMVIRKGKRDYALGVLEPRSS